MIKKMFNQRGEVASFLTVVSMVVLSVGLLFGYQINRNTAGINLNPFAQEPKTIPSIGVNDHDQVCYPGGDKDSQVRDQYCRTRMIPQFIQKSSFRKADPRPLEIFRKLFKGTSTKITNPFITTIYEDPEADPDVMNIYGGLCVNNKNIKNNNVNGFTTKDVEVYISVFGVRKFYTENANRPAIDNLDIGEVLKYKIAQANDNLTSDNDDTVFLLRTTETRGTGPRARTVDVAPCSFTNGSASSYAMQDNPILFNISTQKQNIVDAVRRAKNDTDTHAQQHFSEQFDGEKCEVYVHLKSNNAVKNDKGRDMNKPGDTYNIFAIDLKDYLTLEEIAEICEPKVTPTGSQKPAACFEKCDTTTSCDADPVTGGDMSCYTYVRENLPWPPRFPDDQNNTDAKEGPLMRNCQLDDKECYCIPDRCVGANNMLGCLTYEVACLPDKSPTPTDPLKSPTPTDPLESPTPTDPLESPTPTDPLESPTPTDTPPITPTPQACRFESLAYVQLCNNINKDTGRCENLSGQGMGLFDASPVPASVLNEKWGVTNNKQYESGRYDTLPASRFRHTGTNPMEIGYLADTFPYIKKEGLAELSYYAYVTDSLNVPQNPLQTGSAIAEPILQIVDPGINAPFDPRNIKPVNNPAYYNFEEASVRISAEFGDGLTRKYQVVPDGSAISSCTNKLIDYAPDNPYIINFQACNMLAFQSNRYDKDYDPSKTDYANRDPQDTIAGMKVGCGQNIVYGWTLQECTVEPADYIFVIDASTTMGWMSYPYQGLQKVKLDAAIDALDSFLTNIQSVPGSRAALVQFNAQHDRLLAYKPGSTTERYESRTKIVSEMTSDIDAIKRLVPGIKNDVKEGTCIDCGLNLAGQVLQRSRQGQPESRKTYVIVLTDGIPNTGKVADPAGYDPIVEIDKYANIIKGIPNTSIMGIAFGDPSSKGSEGYVIENITRIASADASGKKYVYVVDEETSIKRAFNNIQSDLNSCGRSVEQYASFLRNMDINGDGTINTIDLFLVYDNYFGRGADVPEDINNDQVVNSLDVSLIVTNIGKTVPQENNTAQKTIGDLF